VLGEILTWIGVAVAGGVAWGLYAFGEQAPRRRFRREQRRRED
jgi:hypothetical protein